MIRLRRTAFAVVAAAALTVGPAAAKGRLVAAGGLQREPERWKGKKRCRYHRTKLSGTIADLNRALGS